VRTEFNGAKLAFASLFHDVEVLVGAVLVVFLFLGGPLPFPLLTIGGVVSILLKFLPVVFLLVAVKASSARYRIDQAIGFFGCALLVALVTLVIASARLSDGVVHGESTD
jgi:NADH-quinone oxidoreductase subunit H